MVRGRSSSWLGAALGALFAVVSHAEAAVTANIVATTLTVTGDGLSNSITVRVVAGNATRLEVLDGLAVIGSFSRASFSSISVQALGGNDTIVLSRVNGEITEGAVLNGGAGNDLITDGAGNDQLLGGTENDQFFWHPGDGNDVVDGEVGSDLAEINGANVAEVFTITGSNSTLRVIVSRDLGGSLDIGTTESVITKSIAATTPSRAPRCRAG